MKEISLNTQEKILRMKEIEKCKRDKFEYERIFFLFEHER